MAESSDRWQLSVYPLRLTLMAREPIALEEHPGSALRGVLFGALLRRFCLSQAAPTCAECELRETCPVAGLVAPLRDERPRGRDIPRPFVLEAPISGARTLEVGETFSLGLTLIGSAARYFPYVALAAQVMEQLGVGRPLRVNGGRRGRFTVERIALEGPLAAHSAGVDVRDGGTTEAGMTLYTRGSNVVATPDMPVVEADVTKYAQMLPDNQLMITFSTPTRLIERSSLLRAPDLAVIVARMAECLDALCEEYGELSRVTGDVLGSDRSEVGPDSDVALPRRERAQRLVAEARGVRLVKDETRWVDVASYSTRQGRATPIGGFVGDCAWEGVLTVELRELLVWGELLHVGKNAVKGDGQYRIESLGS